MVATAVAAGSLALGAYGTYQQQQATKQMGRQQAEIEQAYAEHQKQIAQFNSAEMMKQAVRLRDKAKQDEDDLRTDARQLLSRQRAQLGASGIVMDSGSAADIQRDTMALAEIDAMRMRRNYADEVGAIESRAAIVRAEGDAALSAGYARAAATRSTANAQASGIILSGLGDFIGSVDPSWFSRAST